MLYSAIENWVSKLALPSVLSILLENESWYESQTETQQRYNDRTPNVRNLYGGYLCGGKCRLDFEREATVGSAVSAQRQSSHGGQEGAWMMAIYCLFHS